jgi:hypothetical protein
VGSGGFAARSRAPCADKRERRGTPKKREPRFIPLAPPGGLPFTPRIPEHCCLANVARPTSISWPLGSAAAVAALLLSHPARAQSDEVVLYDVAYRAPAICPAEAAFTGLIARRTARARRVAAAGAVKYRFTVEVALNEAGARGSLRIDERDGASTERDVPARDCADAVEAMALIAAVILDPRAAAAAPSAGAAPLPSAAPARATPAAPAREPARREPPAIRPAAAAAPPAPARGEPWRVRARVAFLAQGAVAEDTALGAAAGAEAFLERPSWFEPRAALTANFALAETSTRFGNADFRWYAGRVIACPVKWPEAERLVLRACGFADAGALHAEGRDTLNARSSTAFWLALGPAAEVELELDSWFSVALEAGVSFPMFHDRFIFAPEEVAHEIPAAGAWFAVGFRIGP